MLANKVSRVAIVGPAGIGKTTLATEVVWAAKDARMFNEIVWHDTSASPPLGNVLRNWLGLLGEDDTYASLRELSQRWQKVVQEKQILVVVDGVESITPSELDLLTPAGCAVLLTARRRLAQGRGFSFFTLKPMTKAESAELLQTTLASFGDLFTLSDKAVRELASDGRGNPAALLLIAEQMHIAKADLLDQTTGARTPFLVGQTVVYPNHGLGVIEKIDEQLLDSSAVRFYSIRLSASKSVVRVPASSAADIGLRTPISASDCKRLLKRLEGGFIPNDDWKERYKINIDRMRDGDAFEVAKVLKELTYISRLKPLSFRDQRMLERARYVLVSELAAVTRWSEAAVEARLDNALAIASLKTDSRPL